MDEVPDDHPIYVGYGDVPGAQASHRDLLRMLDMLLVEGDLRITMSYTDETGLPQHEAKRRRFIPGTFGSAFYLNVSARPTGSEPYRGLLSIEGLSAEYLLRELHRFWKGRSRDERVRVLWNHLNRCGCSPQFALDEVA